MEELHIPDKSLEHKKWVKISHWIATLGFLLLAFTGFEILMVHPRLYWGEVGNELTPAILEFPISRNYQHGSWQESIPFFEGKDVPVSAARTFDPQMFNENGWGRSLHFLAAWILILIGVFYLITGIVQGHFRNYIWPGIKELSPGKIWRDVKMHLQLKLPDADGGPRYGVLQKMTYSGVIFFVLPLAIITGLTMSPAITASFPFLLDLFGGMQSARTIHFFTSLILELFLVVHIIMVIITGFKKQIRYMTIGK